MKKANLPKDRDAKLKGLPMDGSLAAKNIKKYFKECVFMKKKMLLILLAVAVSVSMIAAATMAWFTADAEAPNAVFTAGTVEVDVDLLTEGEQIDLGTLIDGNWNPGDTNTVTWKIKNTGTKAMVFRIKPDVRVERLNQNFDYSVLPALPSPWNGENLRGTINAQNGAPGDNWNIESGTDNKNWNEHVYYYKYIVPAGGDVTLSMDITLKGEETGNAYQAATFIIGGTVEAIQASNFAPYHEWSVNYYGVPSFD